MRQPELSETTMRYSTLGNFTSAFRSSIAKSSVLIALAAFGCAQSEHGVASSTCAPQWQARFGSINDDEARSIVRGNDGAVYVAGYENGILGVENDWPVGDSQGYVEKRSRQGELIWRHVFDSNGTDLAEAVEFDDTRNRVIVAGRTNASIAESNAGQFDIFLAELDAQDGELRSLEQFGDIYPEHPASVAISENGDVIVAGLEDTYVEGNAALGRATSFVARFATDAPSPHGFALQWWLTPNEPAPLSPASRAFAAAPMHDGTNDVIVASTSVRSSLSAMISRIHSDKTLAWQRQVSPSPLDVVFSVATSSGKIYIAGTTVMALAGEPLGNSDAFLMEVDPNTGAPKWGTQFGSSGVDWLTSLAIGDDGTLYVAGTTNGAIVPGNAAVRSIFALSFSPQGELQGGWQTPVGSSGDFIDSLKIVPTCEDIVLLAGHVQTDTSHETGLGKNDSVVFSAQLHDLREFIFESSFESNDENPRSATLPATRLISQRKISTGRIHHP